MRANLARIGAWLAVVVCAGFAVVYFAKALSQLSKTAEDNSAVSFSDREIAGGNSILVDQHAAYEARGLIPENETYRVVTGSGVKDPTSLTLAFVESWFRYFLMPRRPASDANWVICYGCDFSQLGGSYAVLWRDANGISIGRLK